MHVTDVSKITGWRRAGHPLALWRNLGLARQFIACACLVSLASVAALGLWITNRVEKNAVETTAYSIALYIEHFISPHLQELTNRAELSAAAISTLDRVNQSAAVRMGISAIKVWAPEGRVLYSTNKSMIGQRFSIDDTQRRAWGGQVAAEYNKLDAEESKSERAKGLSLYEVYVPIRALDSEKIIAVAEFYQNAEVLESQLQSATWQSWVVTLLVSIAMIGALSFVVLGGDKVINEQREALAIRVAELSQLLSENRRLYGLVESNAQRANDNHERFLREIGSDIHDGPAQLIALAMLRLNDSNSLRNPEAFQKVREAIDQALKELRNISAGLVLPEVPTQDLRRALKAVIRHHENRTQTKVAFECRNVPRDVSDRVKNGLCRFVQEALNNAFKHAGGRGQRVRVWSDDDEVKVEVSDQGSGLPENFNLATSKRLGLICLADRIEHLGGTLAIKSQPGVGTQITAIVPAGVS